MTNNEETSESALCDPPKNRTKRMNWNKPSASPRVQVLKSSVGDSTDNLSGDGTSITPRAKAFGQRLRSPWSRTLVLRATFVLCLIAAVVVCSFVSYHTIRDLEVEVGKQTYESVAASALQGAKEITLRKFQGAKVMESILSFAFPDASMWPLVALDGYYHIAGAVADLASSGPIGMSVFVDPGEARSFEAYTQQHYVNQGYPSEAGLSDFGFGIWTRDAEGPYEDGRRPSRTGNETTYESNTTLLSPLMDHTIWNTSALMYDIHSTDPAVNAMIECDRQVAASLDAIPRSKGPGSPQKPPCTVTTGFKKLISRTDLATLIDQPIYPANDPTTLVGFIGTSIQWEEVLTNVVPDYISGIFAVISTDSQMHSNTGFDTATFVIQKGVPIFLGEGDRHDPAFDDYARSCVLNNVATNATTSVKHRLTIYPSAFDQFQTHSPMSVALGFAAVITICTIIFFLYDFLMRRDINERKVVLEMKRRFVRFISHEIRTPLNTVCMGLELLESELQGEKPDVAGDGKEVRGSTNTTADVSYWHDITQDIQENASSAVGILNELLKYDKIETGNLELEVGQVLMWDLVQKTVNLFKLQSLNKEIEMTFTVKAEGTASDLEAGGCSIPEALRALVVVGDDMRLREVVRNLISNSLKFTGPTGKIHVTVERIPNGLQAHKKRRWGQQKQSTGSASSSDPTQGIHSLASYFDYPRAGSILVSVSDSGVGMNEEQLAKVFVEGVQFNANRLQAGGGSGLGLCISKSIIERHHGLIVARSPGEGKGCTFTVELPLFDASGDEVYNASLGSEGPQTLPAQDDIKSLDQARSHQGVIGIPKVEIESGPSPPEDSKQEVRAGLFDMQMQTAPAPLFSLPASLPPPLRECSPKLTALVEAPLSPGKHHVLVVDDVLSNRKMLCRLLERAGHTCLTAGDGQQAIDAIVANRRAAQQDGAVIDSVLMDFEMPVLNGPDATAKLRELGYDGTILGVTGNVLKEDVDYFVSKGANEVLPKPVSMKLLNQYWESHSSFETEHGQAKQRSPGQQCGGDGSRPDEDTKIAGALAA